MEHLHPVSFGTSAVRSYSAGSYASSNGSASSSASMQDTTAAAASEHTPSTSPSLSDRSASSPQASSNCSKLPSQAHQPSSSNSSTGPRSSSSAGLSPLELLVKRGMQVQQDILAPEDENDSKNNTSTHRILERASALSRKTSVRKPPIQPSPDPDDFDDAQSIRSVNLLSDAGSSFSRGQRGSAPSSAASSPDPGSSFSVQRGYKASYDDSTDSYTPTQPESDWRRQSSHLLSNAFRNSIASDISFNSITADDPDSSLSRRASIDTVRSSEFGEHGRWGRAWASRAEDEESLYGESAYGDNYDHDQDGERSHAIDATIDLDPSRGPLSSNLGLDSVARQWKLDHAPHLASAGSKPPGQNTRSNPTATSSIPAIREVASKEKIVSLTRSVPPPTTTTSRLQQPALSHVAADQRHSFVPQIETHDCDAPPHQSQLYDRTPMASADRYLGHRSTSSTATITGDSTRAHNDSPPTARVYVYPPSPSGSEASTAPGGAAQHQNGTLPSKTQQRYVSMPSPTSAQVETMAAEREAQRTPLAPSSLLSNPRSVSAGSAGSAGSQRPRSSGHPAGRVPPPPPPPAAASGTNDERSPLGYSDPNQYFQGIDRPIIGRKRAEAIARADGRESMVSDLDVETLRLDGSSRRDSSSTIGSVMTSRMSIGSVSHDPVTLESAAAWRNSRSPALPQNVVSPKPSQSSLRSLQPVQDTSSRSSAGVESAARPPMLRNAKSANAIPNGPPGSVAMQPTASAPPTGLGLGLGANATAAKPRTSPAVDTRTGPSSAEDFLSQGITYHEQGDLARSAFYFERSAKVDGGCVVGMCMFGMALREGWGARKDPVKGFSWIQRAAARAGEMMSTTTTPKTDSELRAIKSELKLSVYELGKCFCYGWGVKMDKHMALEYFELAAKLGDADAQAEAGALYAAGKGCKKDLKKAAMYYRMAEAGGYDTVGLSWIHKDKYK